MPGCPQGDMGNSGGGGIVPRAVQALARGIAADESGAEYQARLLQGSCSCSCMPGSLTLLQTVSSGAR
jgi:hypothetical protein